MNVYLARSLNTTLIQITILFTTDTGVTVRCRQTNAVFEQFTNTLFVVECVPGAISGGFTFRQACLFIDNNLRFDQVTVDTQTWN